MTNVLVFVASLLAPLLIIRIAIHLILERPHETASHIRQGVSLHHLHLGLLLALIAALLLLFTGSNVVTIAFLGGGLGLILDEFIPSVLIPNHEPESTQIYLRSLQNTILLFISIVAITLIFYFLLQYR